MLWKDLPGLGMLNQAEREPEPKRISDTETKLRDAKKSLQNTYQNQVNLDNELIPIL